MGILQRNSLLAFYISGASGRSGACSIYSDLSLVYEQTFTRKTGKNQEQNMGLIQQPQEVTLLYDLCKSSDFLMRRLKKIINQYQTGVESIEFSISADNLDHLSESIDVIISRKLEDMGNPPN